jgi:2-phosphosulfolactate phosphatase
MRQTVPQIRILQGISGAVQARGLAVVIDVMRAFSTACYAVHQGARGIIPVASVKAAFDLKRSHPDWILMGERNGIKVPGFDLGNSPSEINDFGSFHGKIIIQTTSNGTRGIAAARNADTVITGSFVNAKAIIAFIHSQKIHHVDLICMGTLSGPAVEDDQCAAYIADLIKGETPDLKQMQQDIYYNRITRKSFTNENKHFLKSDSLAHKTEPNLQVTSVLLKKDLSLCISANIFNFILLKKTFSKRHSILLPQSSQKEPIC